MVKDHIDVRGFLIILTLTFLWGLNYPAIKLTNTGLAPIFTGFFRTAISTILAVLYCIAIKQRLFHRGIILFHGIMIGILFGLEFVCIYWGMFYTDSARSVIFIYLSPFVVAGGAHFFLGERLTTPKMIGLILAFLGIYSVFSGKPHSYNRLMFFGDVLEIMAAFFWGATTLYIKRFLTDKIEPINTFIYQILFSLPILFLCTFFLEDTWVKHTSIPIVLSIIYQSVIIGFASYFIWIKLIHIYPVGRLSAFTFLTPVFGVLLSAAINKEELTIGLLSGLTLVCVGIYCANYRYEKT